MIKTKSPSSGAGDTRCRAQRYQGAFVAMGAENRRRVCDAVCPQSQHLLVVREGTLQVADLKMNGAWMRGIR